MDIYNIYSKKILQLSKKIFINGNMFNLSDILWT